MIWEFSMWQIKQTKWTNYQCWAGIKTVFGHHPDITRASQSDPPRAIVTSDIRIENWTTGSHVRENQMWEPGKVWPITRVKVSRFSRRQKLVQAMRKKLWGSIAGTMFSQPNLIRAKRKTPFLLNSHQNLLVRFNLLWEMGEIQGRANIWW